MADMMPSKKLILLVDDEPAILDATKTGLLDRGFNVKTVEGGDAAMDAIRTLKPSIVVSDLVMPGTNGFELYQKVKQQADISSTPFIFLTGVDDYYAKRFGKEIGAAYITKPVDLDELEHLLTERLEEPRKP
jgi:two-component system alkaline phosphatase synthesis response regulator PhoP